MAIFKQKLCIDSMDFITRSIHALYILIPERSQFTHYPLALRLKSRAVSRSQRFSGIRTFYYNANIKNLFRPYATARLLPPRARPCAADIISNCTKTRAPYSDSFYIRQFR